MCYFDNLDDDGDDDYNVNLNSVVCLVIRSKIVFWMFFFFVFY